MRGYSAGSTELLWDTQQDAGRDALAGSTGWRDTRRIHWRATLGYSTAYWANPLAGLASLVICCGILGGIHWRAALAGYSAASRSGRDTRRDPLASRSGGILGDPLSISSGRILGGIHWRAAPAGYSAGSTGELLWRDTRRDPLASCSGGILGGIHWRAALAGYSAGSTGELLWRENGWGRGVEASQTRIPT